MTPSRSNDLSPREKRALRITSVLVVLLAIVVAVVLIKTKPQSRRARATQGSPLVDVAELVAADHQVEFEVTGTLEPAIEVNLQARVAGQVLRIHSSFIEGGRVQSGDTLVWIDPTDYALALENSRNAVETARVSLLTEEGRQEIALREYELMGFDTQELSDTDRDLVLRQPQLRAAQAALRSAEAALRLAELNLERTAVLAPVDGLVTEAAVDLGDMVTTATSLGRLAGSDSWWLRCALPVDEVQWIDFPASGKRGSQVSATSIAGVPLSGRVKQLEAELESGGRMARLVIEIPNPLKQASDAGNPLMLGEYLEAVIHGITVQNVVAVNREYMHDGSQIWLVGNDGMLSIQSPERVWADEEHVLLRGLDLAMHVVTSSLTSAVDGMSVRVSGDTQAQSGKDGAE